MPSDTSPSPERSPIRSGVRLALDWGQARIGVAACDAQAILSYPVETIRNDAAALDRIRALVAEYEPIEVVLGLPTDLRGRQGLAAERMLEVANRLTGMLTVPVRLVDERMSSAAAARQLSAAGRSSRSQRSVIDQAAAVAILDHALDTERRTGRPPERHYPGGEGQNW